MQAIGLLHKVCHSQGTMDVQLSEVRMVTVPNLKSQFRIPPEDVIMAGNMPFIRLRSRSWTLMNLVSEDNPDSPFKDNSFRGQSLTCCIGLSTLTQRRNDLQAEHLAPPGGLTLFEAVEKPKKRKMSRMEAKTKRDEHVPMSIDFEMDGATHSIEVLRPVHARDALYVSYDASSVGAVLKYMRDSGFADMKHHFQHQGAPGIHKRDNCFVVATTDGEGQKHFKRTSDIDTAMLVQAGGSSSCNDIEPDVRADMADDADGDVHAACLADDDSDQQE